MCVQLHGFLCTRRCIVHFTCDFVSLNSDLKFTHSNAEEATAMLQGSGRECILHAAHQSPYLVCGSTGHTRTPTQGHMTSVTCDTTWHLSLPLPVLASESNLTVCACVPQVICTKVRDGDKRIVRLKEGEPRGRHVVIVDDLVQSGGTLRECQKLLSTQVTPHRNTVTPQNIPQKYPLSYGFLCTCVNEWWRHGHSNEPDHQQLN